MLRRAGRPVDVVHFHLRTNVRVATDYREAMEEALGLAAAQGWRPAVLDIGGGFPANEVCDRRGRPVDGGFSVAEVRAAIEWALGQGAGIREVWLENGRRLTASGGVLAFRVLDEKEGRGVRTLVCDGGRTLHALVATWERHRVIPLEPAKGRCQSTLLYGPTCMAFDNLGRHELPVATGPRDVLLWLEAGAYQLSWETRFSHGLAPVVWSQGGSWELVREAEGFGGAPKKNAVRKPDGV
jgi:diaminopimelate decarboxylase